MILLLFFLVFIPYSLLAQELPVIDSLKDRLFIETNDTVKVKILNALAWEYRVINTDTAMVYARQAFNSAMRYDFKTGIANACNNIGTINILRGNYRTALYEHLKALKIYETIKNLPGAALTFLYLSHAYENADDYEHAKEYAFKSLKIREKLQDKMGIADCFNNIGSITFKMADYTKSIEYMTKAVKIYEELNDKQGMAHVYNNLGITVCASQGNFEDAINYCLKSLEIYTGLSDKRGIARIYNNIGNIYQYKTDYPKALKNYFNALKILEQLNDARGTAQSYTNIGTVYTLFFEQDTLNTLLRPITGQQEIPRAVSRITFLDSALFYQLKAYEIHKLLDIKLDMVYSLNGLGKILMKQEKPQEALEFFINAMDIAKRINAKNELVSTYKEISDAYRTMGNYKDALIHYDYYSRLSDSVLSAAKTKQIAEMKEKYEADKKEKEIKLLTVEKEKHLVQNKILWMILTGGVSFLIIITVLIYNRNKIKQREKLKTELLKQQEIHTRAIIDVQEQERTRIAKDLHDGIGQILAGIIANFERFCSGTDDLREDKRKLFQNVSFNLDNAYKDLRAISHRMMPGALKEAGLSAAVSDLLEKTLTASRFKYSFEAHGVENIPEKIAIGTYRIFQELLSNILKHAEAENISVQLFRNQNHLIMIVEDDGIGFGSGKNSINKQNGIGLANINGRSHAMQGEFSIGPGPVKGTVASLRIPLQNSNA